VKYKVLLIGLGQVAMGYDLDDKSEDTILTHAKAFSAHPGFELVGGVDPSQERRALFAKHYSGYIGDDLVAALATTTPDIVIVASPTSEHASVMKLVLEKSQPKLVLCEKPLAYSLDEARAMVQSCEERDCLLYVNYLRRVDPGVREVKRRFMDGRIEMPVKGVAWYTKGLLHNGSHLSNLLELWLGPVSNIKVIDTGRFREDLDLQPDVQVTFASGRVIFLAANEENFSHHEIQLVTPNGCLRYEQGGGKIVWQPSVVDSVVDGYTVLSAVGENISTDVTKLQWHVADSIYTRLNEGRSDLCSGEEALQTLVSLMEVKKIL